MATFSGINEQFKKHVEQLAQKAMSKGNSVKSTVIEEGKIHVKTDVYDVYTPKVYERTSKLQNSWDWQDTPDGIEIVNTRTDDGRYVAEIVETGQGYQYDFPYNGVPRPFVENTRESLRKDDRLKNALKKDMQSIGLDVK